MILPSAPSSLTPVPNHFIIMSGEKTTKSTLLPPSLSGSRDSHLWLHTGIAANKWPSSTRPNKIVTSFTPTPCFPILPSIISGHLKPPMVTLLPIPHIPLVIRFSQISTPEVSQSHPFCPFGSTLCLVYILTSSCISYHSSLLILYQFQCHGY